MQKHFLIILEKIINKNKKTFLMIILTYNNNNYNIKNMNLKISKKNLISLSKIKRPLVFVPMAADILHHGHINIIK